MSTLTLEKEIFLVAEDEIIQHISLDYVLFSLKDGNLNILLIKRNVEPLVGAWALPGALIYQQESLEEAAVRGLQEVTGITNIYTEQLQTFGGVSRYPGKRVITIAYSALVNPDSYYLAAGNGASDVAWFSVNKLPHLPFDHNLILETAFKALQRKILTEPVGFELLPSKFTLSELQALYEAVLQKTLDKRNFRKKILNLNLVEKLDAKQTGVAHRAAHYYRFNKEQYDKLKTNGFQFI
jgi:8-oxo-dGTP diphosphatase